MFHQQYAVRLFSFRGIDVSMTFWFGFLIILISILPNEFTFSGPLLAGAIGISLILHEVGHAYVCKRYELEPSILLHGFGGACIHRPAPSDSTDATVVIAGPVAGLASTLLFVGIWFILAHTTLLNPFPPIAAEALTNGVWYLVAVGATWNAVNLFLPIWPLDGGKLFHLALRQVKPDEEAQELMLKTSLCTTLAAGLAGGLLLESIYIGLMGIFILLANVRLLRSKVQLARRPDEDPEDELQKQPSELHQSLLERAEQAFAEGNWQEAYRLGHQLRSMGSMPGKTLERVWELLALATTHLERYEEALNYINQLGETTSEVEKARETCLEKLENTSN